MRRTFIVRLTVTLLMASACTSNPPPTVPTRMPTATRPTTGSASATAGATSPVPGSADLAEVAARAAHSATALPGGEILIAGGCIIDGCGTATNATFVVAGDGGSARQGPAMSSARDGHTATLFDGQLFIAGGFPGEGSGTLSSVDLYAVASRQLRWFGDLGTGRGGHAGAVLGDSGVLIVGGWIRSHAYTASTELLDPVRGPVDLPDLPWAADALDAVTLADGRVLVTGGQFEPAHATDQAAIYDSVAGVWTSVGPMGTPRLKHTGVLLDDGRVLIMGGSPDDTRLLSTTELFDPATNEFTPGPNLVEPRYKMPGGAVALPGGRVLIAGGGLTVELLDVAKGRSEVVRQFGVRGSFTTITPLADGQWLVVGGYDDRIALTHDYAVVSVPSS